MQVEPMLVNIGIRVAGGVENLMEVANTLSETEIGARGIEKKGKGFRPHAKTHKCPEIARRQMAAGAVGICAAKVSEAFVLVNAGISKVLAETIFRALH